MIGMLIQKRFLMKTFTLISESPLLLIAALSIFYLSCAQPPKPDIAHTSNDKKMEKSVAPTSLSISSTAFAAGGMIPSKYTCDGANVNPPLDIEGIPDNAKSLALIVDDPDAPAGTWVHWVVWNIPVASHLNENEAPGTQGTNDFNRRNYGGPCPPSGTHRYFFKVYALDAMLNLPDNTGKSQLLKAMEGHIVASGELMGLYQRKH